MKLVDFITERDMLLTRILLAIQAETDLDSLNVLRVQELLDAAGAKSAEVRAFFTPGDDLRPHIAKLHTVGWVHYSDANPHVSVTAPGILTCGAIPIPDAIASAFPTEFNAAHLT
jgi:hypothetical protein